MRMTIIMGLSPCSDDSREGGNPQKSKEFMNIHVAASIKYLRAFLKQVKLLLRWLRALMKISGNVLLGSLESQ